MAQQDTIVERMIAGSIPESIYSFDPLGAARDDRTIVLESKTTVPATSERVKVAVALEKPAPAADLVREVLTPELRSQLATTLQAVSSLPKLVTQQIFQHLLRVYQHKVEQTIQTEGLAAIDTSLPHFKLVNDRKTGTKSLELVLTDEKIQAYLEQSLTQFFIHAGIWHEFATTIGANLVLWALEKLELTIATPQSEISQAVEAYLQPQSPQLHERLEFLAEIYCQDIAKKIIAGFNLPHCSLKEMERLLGLKQRPPARVEKSFDLNPIAVLPSAIPIASSIRAQLRPDLWQQNSDQLAVFQHRSKSNPGNYIEHYITNPGDIALLPWEAAEQIINKFGFDTVKLQLICAARTMEEDEPWNSTFTLRATDIIHLLGWDKNHSTSLPEKRNAIASTAYALSCLLVKSVWVEGQGRNQVDASTPIGRMWDVLIDPHGQFDWVTGKIEKPDEVYITVSPGLWTKHFLNRAGSKAKEALHQFGYLAKDILKIDPYHNEMALRLAIQLTLDARVRVRNQHPYDYRVLTLLEEVLPKCELEKALQDKHKARDLKNRWHGSLQLLRNLGWQIEFDPETYPDWLQPGSDAPKPVDWRKIKVLDRLLQAKLTIKPPHPIPDLLATIKEPKRLKPPEPTLPVVELTGLDILKGREAIGWSRKELGGFLNLSADYIGKLERGDRLITPELATSLRKLLHLK
jgi:hypothetical protein